MVELKPNREKLKAALARVIAPYAFWSYVPVDSDKVSDERLIEAVLLYGNDALRLRLFKLFNADRIREVWEQRLVIQGNRLYNINKKIASEFLHLSDPEYHIQQAYKKYNLYDRFSA
jgi:hypothetical protein